MSFKCQGCNAAQPTGTAPNRMVIETRMVGGSEWDAPREEIAKEQNLCGPCSEPFKVAAAEKAAAKYAIKAEASVH